MASPLAMFASLDYLSFQAVMEKMHMCTMPPRLGLLGWENVLRQGLFPACP